MSKFTKELIDDYAHKLLINLTEEEYPIVLKEFDIIEMDMNLIADFPDIKNVTPMFYPLDDFCYELREDAKEENEDLEDILKNCGSYEDREVKIPKVVAK